MNSGEISPLLYGRPDYLRNQSGLRTCRGFIPLRQGGVTRAPGTIYRGSTKLDTQGRLIAFEFAINDAVVLEFTPNVMRVWRYGVLVMVGGSPYEMVTPYDAVAIPKLQWVQSADVIYFVDGVLPIQQLSRYALDNWIIGGAVIEDGPFQVQNLGEAITIQASAETGTGITLTGVGTSFAALDVGSLISFRVTDDTSVPTWTGNTGISVGGRMRYDGRIYEVTAGSDTGVNPPTHIDGEVKTEATGITWMHITDGHGIVRITAVAGATAATADVLKTVPGGCVTSPTYRWSEGAWSEKNGYPSSIGIIDQRLIAANTSSSPRTLWASTLGAYLNFEPVYDPDGAFAYNIGGTKSQNSIVWLKDGSRGLHIGALGEEFSSVSTNDLEAISSLNVAFRRDTEIGCKDTMPIAPDGKPIFISGDGKRVFEIGYAFAADQNEATELSLPAEHIGAVGFEEIVWQDAPVRIGWLRRSAGDLALMIYDPREEVLGWSTVPVSGEVESICVTRDATGSTEILTMIVKRMINGTTRRYVEEMAEIFGLMPENTPIAEAVHLYSSVMFAPGSPTDTFTGLDHLEGEEVYAWTDEGEMGPVTVVSASVTLAGAVNRATIGKSEQEAQSVRTLDVVAGAQDGATMGRQKRLKGVGVRLHRTSALLVRTVEIDFGQDERSGQFQNIVAPKVPLAATTAYSGTVHAHAPSGMAPEVSYEFRPVGGAPATILGLVPFLDTASR